MKYKNIYYTNKFIGDIDGEIYEMHDLKHEICPALVSKEYNKFLVKCLEKCGYDGEWCVYNQQRINLIGNPFKDQVYIDHNLIFEVIKEHVNIAKIEKPCKCCGHGATKYSCNQLLTFKKVGKEKK